MKSLYFFGFIILIIMAGWFIRPIENMEAQEDEIYGPKGVDPRNSNKVYPRIFSPKAGWAPERKPRSEEIHLKYPDDGEFRSDTASQNAAYMNVFTYQPFLSGEFPLPEGPPEPYLNDFSRIHH
jgi:hypothetical protein